MCVCVYVCMFAIGGRAVGPIWPKFCTEMQSYPESVIGYIRTRPLEGRLRYLQKTPDFLGKNANIWQKNSGQVERAVSN